MLSEKRLTDYELTVRSRTGNNRGCPSNATTFDDRGRTLQGVFAAARVSTERKRVDHALEEKNSELESARPVREGQLCQIGRSSLSGMSHELRSLLKTATSGVRPADGVGFSLLDAAEKEEHSPILQRDGIC